MLNVDEWRFSLDVAWDDPWYRWQSVTTVAVLLLGTGWFLWQMIPEGLRSGLLVLHYNLYVGIDEVHPWPWMLLLPGSLILVVFADLFASAFLFRRDRIASRVLLCSASLFTVLSFVGPFFLVSVNL